MNSDRMTPLIQQGISAKIFPGAVAYIAEGGEITYFKAFGHRMITPTLRPMQRETVFDLASLTKPIVVATLMMRLVEARRVDLHAPVRNYLRNFTHRQVTIFHLLAHTSGLPAWKALYLETASKEQVFNYLCEVPLEYPTGDRVVYSCLGYILLGMLIEKVAGESLDSLAHRWIFQPLQMNQTRYTPPPEWADLSAATEDSNSFEKRMTNYRRYDWREEVIVGEVHDENAHFLGGVAGNAGLFSTAADLGMFCQMLVDGGDGVLTAGSIKEIATVHAAGLDASRGIGWIIMDDGSLYHTGFTGTSIRVDLKRKLYAILLTNRVHPDASRTGIIDFRAEFYRSVFEQ